MYADNYETIGNEKEKLILRSELMNNNLLYI